MSNVLGFGAVVTHQKNGISRGTSALVALVNHNEQLLKNPASAHYSFSRGNSKQEYPRSLMGIIALLRQSYYDAQTYQDNQGKVPLNIGWEAWNNQQNLPQITFNERFKHVFDSLIPSPLFDFNNKNHDCVCNC